MKPKTILSLYNGNYTFIERDSPIDERHSKNLSKCIEVEDKLKKLVDDDTFELITKALDHQSGMLEVEIESAFVEGFSLAVSLLLEALSAKN